MRAPSLTSDSAGPVHIATCADRNIAPGLHVTLSSARRSLDPSRPLVVHLFHRGYTDDDLVRLDATLALAGGDYEVRARPISLQPFKGLDPIRGNSMTWARLSLADWLPELDRVVYLDSDLLVNRDLAGLADLDLGGAAAGFVRSGATMRSGIEAGLFKTLGFNLDAPYYNAGVIVMDLAAWRAGVAEEGIRTARRYQGHLPAADQTVLNVLFYDRPVAPVHRSYNVLAFPMAPVRAHETPAVYHFIGAPKPWDLWGEWVNQHSGLYLEALGHTALAGRRSYRHPSAAQIRSVARNVRKYLRGARIQLGLEEPA